MTPQSILEARVALLNADVGERLAGRRALIEAPPLVPMRDGKTWYLYAPLDFDDAHVPASFETDFASTPRLGWAFVPPWGTYGLGAIGHDWNYWTQRCTRLEADNRLLAAMRELGTPAWQRVAIYEAVRQWGWIAWNDNARLAKEGYSRMHNDGATHPCWKRKMVRAAIGVSA